MVEIRQRARHIFQNDNCGFGLSDDASDIRPEVAGVGITLALASVGKGLAREARSHAIHEATPESPVESAEIRPDRGTIHPSVVRSP